MPMHPLVDRIYQLADALAAEYDNLARTGTDDDFARAATERLNKLARDCRPRRLLPLSPVIQAEFERRFDAGDRLKAAKWLRDETKCTVQDALDHVWLWTEQHIIKQVEKANEV